MEKDFKLWFPIKDEIENKKHTPKFFEKEVWWCNLGLNVGYEQDGKGESFIRPVLIFKKHNSKIFTAIPLSSKIKENNKFYKIFSFKGKEQSAIIIQTRAIDSKRLINKMGELSNLQFDNIRNSFFETFGKNNSESTHPPKGGCIG
jgi:mRNA interferase MazF